jgi:hypothetical protein
MMRRARSTALEVGLAVALALFAAGARAQVAGTGEAAAMRVLDEALAAYNASDERAWLATLHFPHVRISGSNVRVFPTSESYLPELSLAQHGWDYAKWTDRRVVQSGVGKVHVVATFTRYRAGGAPVDRFDSLYVIALRKGRWGILAISRYGQ